MEISAFQDLMHKIYFDKDNRRGVSRTFLWLMEELGELAEEIRKGDFTGKQMEMADCLAWLTSLANLMGINLEKALKIYEKGCPKCGAIPCVCPR